MSWGTSIHATSYSIIMTVLSGDNQLSFILLSGITQTSYELKTLKEGLYEFQIIAENEQGNISSNSVSVLVQLEESVGESEEEQDNAIGHEISSLT